MLSKEKYYTSTPPLCLHWETFTFISDQSICCIIPQISASDSTETNKHNSTEIRYWLLLSHWTMHVTKMVTEYYKSANLSTYSAPRHWPEARIHKPPLTVHLSVAVSLSEHQQTIMAVIILVSSLSGQPLFFGTMCFVIMMFGPFSIIWDKRMMVGNELGWTGHHLFVSRLLYQLWCRWN